MTKLTGLLISYCYKEKGDHSRVYREGAFIGTCRSGMEREKAYQDLCSRMRRSVAHLESENMKLRDLLSAKENCTFHTVKDGAYLGELRGYLDPSNDGSSIFQDNRFLDRNALIVCIPDDINLKRFVVCY